MGHLFMTYFTGLQNCTILGPSPTPAADLLIGVEASEPISEYAIANLNS